MQVDYYAKYLKYKQKYLDLKEEMMGKGKSVSGWTGKSCLASTNNESAIKAGYACINGKWAHCGNNGAKILYLSISCSVAKNAEISKCK